MVQGRSSRDSSNSRDNDVGNVHHARNLYNREQPAHVTFDKMNGVMALGFPGITVSLERVGYNATRYVVRREHDAVAWPQDTDLVRLCSKGNAPFGGIVSTGDTPLELRVKIYGCD